MALERVRFATTGLHCASCSRLVQMTLEELGGVTEAASDHRTGLTEAVYDSDRLSTDDLIAAIERVGYGATLIEDV